MIRALRALGALRPEISPRSARQALLFALVCAGLASCRGGAVFDWERRPGPYDRLGGGALRELRQARASFAVGDVEEARDQLTRLFGSHQENISVGACLQELQIETLVEHPLAASASSVADRRRALARLWRQRAEESPSAANLVLAARIEDDELAARVLLEDALATDPKCAWAHFGLAHLAALDGRWSEATERLRDTFQVDPGHPQARRLHAAVLARSGSPVRAIAALERWLDEVGSDPRVAPELTESAYLDLAQLRIERGEVKRARKALEELGGLPDVRQVDQRRRLLLSAAIEQASGRPDLALDAALEAEALEPDDPMPLVQQALLHDLWLGDPIAAQRAWQRLLSRAEGLSDLASRLRVMRAQIELERLGAELEQRPQPGFGELQGRAPPEADS